MTMKIKPTIPKGTRDFSPNVMVKRNRIFDVIRNVFNMHGFDQIETPSMEMLDVLTSKYGGECNKLLFKIQNSGDYFSKLTDEDLLSRDANGLINKFCEKGLRYDLTVPLARYVSMHRNEIVFPFRRYQIQPVWRADRPQKGRYREFYQCDADIIGSDSLFNETELIQMADTVFDRLHLKVTIKINSRKILAGIAQSIGYADKLIDIVTAIDKLDTVGFGFDNVSKELIQKGFSEQSIDKLQNILQISGSNIEKLTTLKSTLTDNALGIEGINEIETLLKFLESVGITNKVSVDFTLARGLNYYTDTIFEIKVPNIPIGSLAGGGRYNNLTDVFGMCDTPGVGISFGADRIFDVLEILNLYPDNLYRSCSTEVLFVNISSTILDMLSMASELREKGVRTEVFPDSAKLKKQLSYANSKGIPFVIIPDSMKYDHTRECFCKNMITGFHTGFVSVNELLNIIDNYYGERD